MRAPISVIVPTLNAEDDLGACLMALMPALESGLIRELIVSDGGSTDATVTLAKAWGGRVIPGPASRGGQLARGCAAAKGDWLLVLHADTVLSPDWIPAARAHMRTQTAGWFQLAFAKGGFAGRVVAGWANLRSAFLGLPYGDQGLLIPKGLYHEVGGFPDQPLMEDVAMARALKGRLQRIDAVAETSAVRYRRQGWIYRGALNFWLLFRYFLGAKPGRLAASYRR